MRIVNMTAKRSGTCLNCSQPINPGQPITWQPKRGAWHRNCETARLAATACSACSGSGKKWNGANCAACDATGSREMQERQRGRDFLGRPLSDSCGIEDRECGDAAYEDDCARRCGLA